MLLIMMILMSVSVSLFVVKNDTVNYTVVTVLGGSIEIAIENNVIFTKRALLSQGMGLKSDIDFRGPPIYKILRRMYK